LQEELFEIVDLKTDIYNKRFKAELNREPENEEQVKHEIQKIRDELFDTRFKESSREI